MIEQHSHLDLPLYFNSEFKRFASLAPANATSFFARAFAAFLYLSVKVKDPVPAPTGAVYTESFAFWTPSATQWLTFKSLAFVASAAGSIFAVLATVLEFSV